MLRGTRILSGEDAKYYSYLISKIRSCLVDEAGLEEIIVPQIYEQEPFIKKGGKEICSQMWTFKDKGNRDVCLIPEVTAVIQDAWNNDWSKRENGKAVFYVSKCYRYERPQAGRYREFTQLGIELLGNKADDEMAIQLLRTSLDEVASNYVIDTNVKRGLGYYTKDGFEARCDDLGAQKQIAGGGRYAEGVGWAIGIDRLMLVPNGKV